MSRTCAICTHIHKKAIDRQILAGGNLRKVAQTHNVSYDSLWRHKRDHLGRAAVAGARIAERNHGDRLLADLDELLIVARRILARAEESDDPKTALLALKESRQSLMNIAQVSHAIWQAQQQESTVIEMQEESSEMGIFMEGFNQLPKRRQKQYYDIIIDAISLSGGVEDHSAGLPLYPSQRSTEEEISRTTPVVMPQNEDEGLILNQEDFSLQPKQVPRRKREDPVKSTMRRSRKPDQDTDQKPRPRRTRRNN